MIHSFKDAKGRAWTACCECDRGGKGNARDKCACGWKIKRWNGAGCYLGSPITLAHEEGKNG